MKEAFSMYEARTIPATEGNHEMSRKLGMICPFEACKESVFWVKGHKRGDRWLDPYWAHYPMSLNSKVCENKCLSAEGREEVKQLQLPATRQRLKLFNRRFWDIYAYEKHIPLDFMAIAKSYGDINVISNHCRDRWDVKAIKASFTEKLKKYHDANWLNSEAQRYFNLDNPEVRKIWDQLSLEIQHVTPLRLKIVNEVIDWLATRTAKDSFKKLIAVGLLYCLEVLPVPIHTQDISNMAIESLLTTNWEKAIAVVKDKYKK